MEAVKNSSIIVTLFSGDVFTTKLRVPKENLLEANISLDKQPARLAGWISNSFFSTAGILESPNHCST